MHFKISSFHLVRGEEQEFCFFSQKPLNELGKKLTTMHLSHQNAAPSPLPVASRLKRGDKSKSMADIHLQRQITSLSLKSDDSDSLHECKEAFDESSEEIPPNLVADYQQGEGLKVLSKTRIDNRSCPIKNRPLPRTPVVRREFGSRDDTYYAYKAKMERETSVPSPLAKQPSRDSGRDSTGRDSSTFGDDNPFHSTQSNETGIPSSSTGNDAKTSRGDSGAMSDEPEEVRFFTEPEDTLEDPYTIMNSDEGGDPGLLHNPQDHLPGHVLFSEESTYSGETIIASRGSIDNTYLAEDGEVYNKLKDDGKPGKKNLEEFLGMYDWQRPSVPPKNRTESIIADLPTPGKADPVVKQDPSITYGRITSYHCYS